MNKTHATSPCCRGRVNKFGKRRRICKLCGKTWRIRQKKRGRKRKRASVSIIEKYLSQESPSLYVRARKSDARERVLRNQLQRGLRQFLFSSNWPVEAPPGPLIAIADAMTQRINGQLFTFYFVLLKTAEDQRAVIMSPRLAQGGETTEMWQKGFQELPDMACERIIALVCDGNDGLVNTAGDYGWILRRCHFHIRFRITRYVSVNPLSRKKTLGKKVLPLVNSILLDRNAAEVARALSAMQNLLPEIRSSCLRSFLSGPCLHASDFRNYLQYPEPNLPTTTNCVESLIGLIRKIQFRAKGFRTIASLSLWVTAVLKHNKKTTCNGHNHQPN